MTENDLSENAQKFVKEFESCVKDSESLKAALDEIREKKPEIFDEYASNVIGALAPYVPGTSGRIADERREECFKKISLR